MQSYLRAGNLVPDDLVIDLVRPPRRGAETRARRLPDHRWRSRAPRRQVELLNRLVDVVRIFKLSVYDENLVIDRMRKRARNQGRSDDLSDEVIQHRLGIYRGDTESCIRMYPGTILTRIHANQPIFDVHFDIIHALAKMRDIHFV